MKGVIHAELSGFGSLFFSCSLPMKIAKAPVLKLTLSVLPVGRLHLASIQQGELSLPPYFQFYCYSQPVVSLKSLIIRTRRLNGRSYMSCSHKAKLHVNKKRPRPLFG